MGSRNKLRMELQVTLGLPKVDRTKTRQMVRMWFELYREKKRLLTLDMEPHRVPVKAAAGYANAMDPDLIRSGGYESRMPRGYGANEPHSVEDEERREFVEYTERTVSQLREYQREIIRRCYMGPEQRPDLDVWDEICHETRWNYSDRQYDEEKAAAIQWLAEAFHIVQYESPVT